jgi:drug/metabolite transporter (DMT)-like permease
MIWGNKAPQEMAVKHTGLSRAFNLLIFQTSVFGIAIFIIVTTSATAHPAPAWLQPMLLVSLIGFAGGILGAFIAFGMLSAHDAAEDIDAAEE